MGVGLANKLVGALRVREFSAECADARASERHRRATLTAVAAAAARIVSVGTSLVTVPIALSYLGTERFGLWMAISSSLATMYFADFGIGNGVMNAVADAHGKNDREGIRSAISSGFAALLAIAGVLSAAFALLYNHIDWASLFNVHSLTAKSEAGPALFVVAVFFLLNVPAGVVQRVQMGLQEGFLSYLWQLAGSITGLVGVLLAVHWHGGLPWLLFALTGSPAMIAVLNGCVFFGWKRRDLLPALSSISRSAISRISHLGALFFVLQLVVAVAFSSDNFIIVRIMGPEAATKYAVPQRMFLMVSTLLGMLTAPLWPAYAEAISRGDMHWVRLTLVRSFRIAMSIALIGVGALVFLGPAMLRAWVHGRVTATFSLLLGLAFKTLLEIACNVASMFLNGASVVKFQVIVGVLFAFVCVTAKVLSLKAFGISGLPWATALCQCLLVAIPTAVVLPRLLRRASSPALRIAGLTL